jgi:L-lactate permease
LATDEEFVEISFKAAIAMCFGSFLLVPLCLRIVIPWELVKHNLVFIFCSLATVMGPVTGISLVSFEFPALIGGMIGCAGTAVLIRFKVGLSEAHSDDVDGREVLDIGTVSENSIVRKHFNSLSSRSEIAASQPPQHSGEDHPSLGITPEEVVADNTAEDEKKEVDPEPFHEQPQKYSFDNDQVDPVLSRDTASETSAIHQNTGALVSLQDTVDKHLGPRKKIGEGYVKELIMRTFPIWAVVVLLVVTRVEQIGVKQYLTKLEPNFAIYFGTYGTFRLSVSGVFQLSNILTYPGLNWKFELLYLPFLMPFVLVAVLTMIMFRKDLDHGRKAIAQTVASRLTNPALALFGALCLVQLLIKIDTAAPAFILGNVLADWFEEAFIMITPLLGALGAFFSGSTTVSNLTFGNIQVIAAESIGTSKTTMLALQAVGASAGNGICLNNIISACAVVGLNVGEGKILMQTYKFVFANTTIATIVMLAFFFRF